MEMESFPEGHETVISERPNRVEGSVNENDRLGLIAFLPILVIARPFAAEHRFFS